jgi:hemoglobin-like flavoprotein
MRKVATMTPVQIEAVKNSWSKVTPIADQASVLFYERLFTLDPSLRALFKPDMTEQRKLLMTMLGTAVGGLDRLETIVPAIQALGRRHKGYGVTEANYATVGQALLWTLEQGLGEAFTPAVREAWTATFVLVSDTMKTAARAA